MAVEKTRMSREERETSSIEKVTKMLNKDPMNVRAVIADTIETKRIADKLQILNVIFDIARNNVGYRVSFEDFAAIHENFKIAEEALQAIISTATEKGIIRPREERTISEFPKYKKKIEELVNAGKTNDEIKAEIGISETKVDGWIANVKTELKSIEPTQVEKEAPVSKKKIA